MSKTTPEERLMSTVTGYVAGNATIHALRRIGTYPSGTPRYAKRCGSNRNDRHDPSPVADTPVTCKRCLAKATAES